MEFNIDIYKLFGAKISPCKNLEPGLEIVSLADGF